jgi:hypothetical protein
MRIRAATVFGLVAIFAGIGIALYPHARLAGSLLMAEDDPGRLADLHLDAALQDDPDLIARNVDAALAAKDADLAASLLAVAAEKNLPLPEDQTQRVAAMAAEQGTFTALAGRFANGLVTGQTDDFASLSGALAGDMFAYGDIRDVVVEGRKAVAGEEADRLLLGLAAAGVAMTATTYATAGSAVPVRAGLTLVKDARKVGRLSEGLASWGSRITRDAVDIPALKEAVSSISLTRLGPAAAAVRASFKTEKAGSLLKAAKDVGRVGEKSGTKGALDALKVAQSPSDLARAAKLAEAKGGQTRAYLKLLGRGALVLLVGAFQLSWWLMGMLLTLLGLLIAIKSASERGTRAAAAGWARWREARRLRRHRADAARKAAAEPAAPALAGPPAPV